MILEVGDILRIQGEAWKVVSPPKNGLVIRGETEYPHDVGRPLIVGENLRYSVTEIRKEKDHTLVRLARYMEKVVSLCPDGRLTINALALYNWAAGTGFECSNGWPLEKGYEWWEFAAHMIRLGTELEVMFLGVTTDNAKMVEVAAMEKAVSLVHKGLITGNPKRKIGEDAKCLIAASGEFNVDDSKSPKVPYHFIAKAGDKVVTEKVVDDGCSVDLYVGGEKIESHPDELFWPIEVQHHVGQEAYTLVKMRGDKGSVVERKIAGLDLTINASAIPTHYQIDGVLYREMTAEDEERLARGGLPPVRKWHGRSLVPWGG